MRIVLLVMVLASYCKNTHSQRHRVDSLRKLLILEKKDTSKAMILGQLSTVYYTDMLNYDSAMYLAKQGLDISKRIRFKTGEASNLNNIASLVQDKGNTARALELYLEALKINESIGNWDGISRNLNNVGIMYFRGGSYSIALQYFLPALAASEREEKQVPRNENVNNSPILGNIASCYRNLRMYDSARYYALRIYQKGKDNSDAIVTRRGLAHIGMIAAEEEQFGIALEYLREAMRISGGNSWEGDRRLWLDIGRVFEKADQMDSALHYARLSFSIAFQAQLPLRIEESATLLARVYRKLNNKDSSLYYLEMAMAARDTLSEREQKAEVENILFNEKFRQMETAEIQKGEKQERKRNLQYAAIAFMLVSFLILFFVFSHSVIAKPKLIRFLGILSLLIVFEFVNLFIHPYLDKWTNHSIPMMLGIMVFIAALLIPLHHKLEHWITHQLVEKNNRIRLAAAKKTIADLEK